MIKDVFNLPFMKAKSDLKLEVGNRSGGHQNITEIPDCGASADRIR